MDGSGAAWTGQSACGLLAGHFALDISRLTSRARCVLYTFMSKSASPLPCEDGMLGLSGWLGLILGRLAEAIVANIIHDRDGAMVILLRLHRIEVRFNRLVDLVSAGRMPRWRTGPRPPAQGVAVREPGEPRPAEPARPARPARSGGTGGLRVRDATACLRRIIGDDLAELRYQLQVLLSEPEIVAVLAAVPQFASVLRPLCRLLGAKPTPPLPPPPLSRPPMRSPPSAEPAWATGPAGSAALAGFPELTWSPPPPRSAAASPPASDDDPPGRHRGGFAKGWPRKPG